MCRLFVALALFVALPAVAREPPAVSTAPDVRVRILGVNDFHGQMVAGKKLRGRPVGSAAVFAAWLRASMKEHDGPTFLALAGDSVGASPAASALLQDEPTVAFLNLLADDTCSPRGRKPCNVIAGLGNHEFDEGADELLRLWHGGRHAKGPFLQQRWRGARFPLIGANVVRADTGRTLVPASVVQDAGGIKIGFIGAVVSSTPSLVTPSGVAGLRFLDEADAVNAEAARLRKRGVQALILVIHEGAKQDAYDGWTSDAPPPVSGDIEAIVRRLDPGIDLVVSGHVHQFTNARLPRISGEPVLVTQAWSGGSGFAEIDLTLSRETGDVTSARARILTAWADEGPGLTPAADAAALTEAASAAVAPLVDRVVGTVPLRLMRAPNDAGESALGNLVADAQRAATGADVALMNPGGLRADLDEGPATWGELFAVQPFGNVLVTVELTGAELLAALEPQGPPDGLRVLHGSGITSSWDRAAPAGRRVIAAEVGGVPVDPLRTYRVTINSFLAAGGDDVSAFARGRRPVGGPLDLDALVAHLQSQTGKAPLDEAPRIQLGLKASE